MISRRTPRVASLILKSNGPICHHGTISSKGEEAKFKKLRIEQLQQDKFNYPHKFDYSHTLKQFRKTFDDLATGQAAETSDRVRVCGRVQSVREVGKKLKFIDILQGESSVQVKMQNKADVYEGDFKADSKFLRRGDVIGIEGVPVRTNAGELSVLAASITLLSPCVGTMPPGPLEKTETKYRKRHLDLMTGPNVREVFRTRSQIIRYLRDFLQDRDFMEVETPTLISGVGGAAAKPFLTHHQDLKMDLSLRIAPELHLKMLTVGGFDRVFEIGKQFRNEGTDKSHNPEFTSCEFYMAYADYLDLISLTQQLLSGMAASLSSAKALDLFPSTAPFKQVDFVDELVSATGQTFPTGDDLNEYAVAGPFLRDLCSKFDIPTRSDRGLESSVPKLYDKLFSHLVEPELKGSTFVCHHPTCMSPLAKSHRHHPHLSERFELFVEGMELVNAYTELNDPVVQRSAFAKQENKLMETNPLQEEYATALEYGLPPTAGWGLGIDRLVMAITGKTSIRDVILFPTMKPLTQSESDQS